MRLVSIFLLLGACATPPELRFAADAGDAWCGRTRACDELRYWRTFDGGTPDCLDWVLTRVRRYERSTGLVCRYDDATAEAALSQIASRSCEDLWDDNRESAYFNPFDCVSLDGRSSGGR